MMAAALSIPFRHSLAHNAAAANLTVGDRTASGGQAIEVGSV